MQQHSLKQAQSSSIVAVSPKRQAWRESVILGRAKGRIRNRRAYLRAALPEFVADELQEIARWLVGRLVEHIDANHPSIDGMENFLRQAAAEHDLPVPMESVIEVINSQEFGIRRGEERQRNTAVLPVGFDFDPTDLVHGVVHVACGAQLPNSKAAMKHHKCRPGVSHSAVRRSVVTT